MRTMQLWGIAVAAVVFVAPVWAQEDMTGTWDLTLVSDLGTMEHKLIVKDGDVTYDAIDNQLDVNNWNVDGDKVTFDIVAIVDGQELPAKFEGTVDGGKLTGEFITDLGNAQVTGQRAVEAEMKDVDLPGTWDVTSESQLGTLERTLVIKDDMTGTYGTEDQNWPIANVKEEGGKLSFDVTVQVQGEDLPLKFAGTREGANLTGEFTSELGNATVTAKKQVAGADYPPDIKALIDEIMTALKEQDIEAMTARYADDFTSDQGGGKPEMVEFLNGAKEQGFLEDIEAIMDNMVVEVDGDKATVDDLELEGAFGVLTLGFELEKRDGEWMVVYQSQY